jgi:hypothetical protein
MERLSLQVLTSALALAFSMAGSETRELNMAAAPGGGIGGIDWIQVPLA